MRLASSTLKERMRRRVCQLSAGRSTSDQRFMFRVQTPRNMRPYEVKLRLDIGNPDGYAYNHDDFKSRSAVYRIVFVHQQEVQAAPVPDDWTHLHCGINTVLEQLHLSNYVRHPST